MKLKIAQIGVGYWGPNLLRNLVANENVHLKKVVDLSSERRQFVESHYPSVQATGDVMEIDDNAWEVIINLVDKDGTLSGIEFKLIQKVFENG